MVSEQQKPQLNLLSQTNNGGFGIEKKRVRKGTDTGLASGSGTSANRMIIGGGINSSSKKHSTTSLANQTFSLPNISNKQT